MQNTPTFLLLGAALLAACSDPGRNKPLELHLDLGAHALANGNGRIELDYTDAIAGFRVPSRAQGRDGALHFHFTLPADPAHPRKYLYKLYYQNETYKFPETQDGGQHPYAQENFYGSWSDAHEGFRTTPVVGTEAVMVSDTFAIESDPRDEPAFRKDGVVRRWARNPRLGEYDFLLVVIPADGFDSLSAPPQLRDIGLRKDSAYVNPFYWYLHGPGSKDGRVRAVVAPERLALVAHPDLGRGIYIDPHEHPDSSAFCASCGGGDRLRRNAPFKQFIHYVDKSQRWENIPEVADVLGNGFSPEDYDHARCFHPRTELVSLQPGTAHRPCLTVRSDSAGHFVEIHNPASVYGDLRKENVGVITRHAFTYGRVRVRAQLTRLLNDSDMWNGLTNAIWMIYEGGDWAKRRLCNKDGYFATYWGGPDDKRVPTVDYAEIDFEILKTVPYCPDRSFPPVYAQPLCDPLDRTAWMRATPEEIRQQRGRITVACTNWDMACHAPPAFASGCQPITHDGTTFLSHRWDDNYRAITQKSPQPDKELFGRPYWFEIDWRPEEIIWRIGPDEDHMRVVGYMNSTMTMIPNVQMKLIVTQEFHNTVWWPGTPYQQGGVPFPAKDYVGRILDVIIE